MQKIKHSNTGNQQILPFREIDSNMTVELLFY